MSAVKSLELREETGGRVRVIATMRDRSRRQFYLGDGDLVLDELARELIRRQSERDAKRKGAAESVPIEGVVGR